MMVTATRRGGEQYGDEVPYPSTFPPPMPSNIPPYGRMLMFRQDCNEPGKLDCFTIRGRYVTPAHCPPGILTECGNLRKAFSSSKSCDLQVKLSLSDAEISEDEEESTKLSKKRKLSTSATNDYRSTSRGIHLSNDSLRHFPIVAHSSDSGATWFIGVLLHLHPESILIGHATVESSRRIKLLHGITKLNPIKDESKLATFHLRYLNMVSKETVCAEDGFIQCDGNGPHRLSSEQLLKSHLREAEEARKRETPLFKLPSFKHPSSVVTPSTDPTKIYKKNGALSARRQKQVTVPCQITQDGVPKCFAIPYMSKQNFKKDSKSGCFEVEVAYIPRERILLCLSEISCKASHAHFNGVLRKYQKTSKLVDLHHIPRDGLVLEGVTSPQQSMNEIYDKRLPHERDGKVLAQWGYMDGGYMLDHDLFLFMIKHAFGKVLSEQRHSVKCLGMNVYDAINQAAYVRATPKHGPTSTLKREKGREERVPLFLPLIYFITDQLSILSNVVGRAADPVLHDFLVNVAGMSEDGNSVRCINEPGEQLNNLKIVTGPGKEIRGLANEGHNDKNDLNEKSFNTIGKIVLESDIKKCSSEHAKQTPISIVKSLKSFQAIRHIHRLATEKDNGNLEWSIKATCGHHIKYNDQQTVDERQLMAIFLYNDLKKAVSIPKNKFVYHQWDAFNVNHQTAVPYTFGKFPLTL